MWRFLIDVKATLSLKQMPLYQVFFWQQTQHRVAVNSSSAYVVVQAHGQITRGWKYDGREGFQTVLLSIFSIDFFNKTDFCQFYFILVSLFFVFLHAVDRKHKWVQRTIFFEKRSCNVRMCEVVRSVCLHVFLCKNFGFIS